jgi:hypothetical protein
MAAGCSDVASLTHGLDDELVERSRVRLDLVAQDHDAVQPLVFLSRLFINTEDVYYW